MTSRRWGRSTVLGVLADEWGWSHKSIGEEKAVVMLELSRTGGEGRGGFGKRGGGMELGGGAQEMPNSEPGINHLASKLTGRASPIVLFIYGPSPALCMLLV